MFWEPFLRDVDVYDSHGEEKDTIIQFYPPPISRRLPVWMHRGLINNVYEGLMPFEDLLRETYGATRNGLTRLAMMGIRAILEQVMIDNVGDHETFSKNLTSFRENGYISKIEFDHLTRLERDPAAGRSCGAAV